MNFSEKTVLELQERKSQIAIEVDAEGADLEALEAEARAINEELEKRKAEEAKKVELRKLVATGKVGTVIEKAPEMEEKRSMKTIEEVRSSREYGQAFLDAWRKGDEDFKECRALLSEQVTIEGLTGNVPVPTMLDTEVKTAWEENQILQLVGRASFNGDYRVAFEVSATGAQLHLEGDDPVPEEEIVLGTVKIENDYIKKFLPVSDKALRGTTVDTIGYIYREMAHRIVAAAEKQLIQLIIDAPATATKTAVGVPSLTVSEITASTLLKLRVLLVSGARNLRVLMNPQTYVAFREIQLAGAYFADVFDGLGERIIFTDELPAFSTAANGDDFIIVGDFGSGALLNFPDGDGIEFIVDPYTQAPADMVNITGKMFVGMGLVADKRFAVATKGAATNG